MTVRSSVLGLAYAGLILAQAPIHVTVHAKAGSGSQIPRTLFGSFLEPIGNSTYNGLWAEILQNPSFESGLWSVTAVRAMITADPELADSSQLAIPVPWQPLHSDQGNRYEPRRGDAANSSESIAIFGVPNGETGVRQEIYLPVHRELTYRGSLFVKHVSGRDVIRVSLRKRNRPDQTLAVAEFGAPDRAWKKYSFELSLARGQMKPLEPIDFAIAVEGDEVVVIDQASLLPADAVDGLDPEMVQMAREMDTPLVRFGGNFTSAYHWRDGIGPTEKRVSMRNVAWGIPETNQFGTDEFLRFCRLIGAEPQIALNLGTGTAEEAADWVRYVNANWPTHGGLLWELGNELWGNWNTAYPTLEQVAGRTLEFSRAVRQADPRARLIATGQDPDRYEQWNAAQLKNPPGSFEFLSTHFVVTTNQMAASDHSPDTMARATFALPVALERKLHDMQRQIVEGGHPRVRIAFTEWLFYCCSGTGGEAPGFDNFGGAVTAGGFLNMLLRNSDIVNISDMTGIVEFAGIWKKRGRVFAAPSYYSFKMFSTADAKSLLKVENTSPTYDVHDGNSRLPNIPGVPYLDVVAVMNTEGDKISVFCVNRNLHEDLEADVALDGTSVERSAEVEELFAPGLYAKNDEMRPGNVQPRKSDTQVSGEHLRFVFRHASLTRIDLKVKRSGRA